MSEAVITNGNVKKDLIPKNNTKKSRQEQQQKSGRTVIMIRHLNRMKIFRSCLRWINSNPSESQLPKLKIRYN